MSTSRHWTLGAKLSLVGAPFALLALFSIAALVWMSWQLEGGAAAVNEAGRMRMQAYRMVLSVSTGETQALPRQVAEFEHSLELLRQGDSERPLFVPWDDTVGQRFAAVEQDWLHFRSRVAGSSPPVPGDGLAADAAAFAAHIDAFVAGIEEHLAHWTALMYLLQVAMMAVAVIGGAVLLYTGHLFVLEPVGLLKQAIDRSLEDRVREKTGELEEKRERLESLYEVTKLLTNATSLEEVAEGFTKSIARIARADGVALRWSDETNRRYLLLASHGLPQAMTDAEHSLTAGDCHCGSPSAPAGARGIPIRTMQPARMRHCAQAGFETVVSLPIRMHERLMGEVDLFFHAQIDISDAERSLLEALTAHLAGAMESLRLNALELEAAVSQERIFL